MDLKLFSGRNACPHCYHPGKFVRDLKGKGYIRYVHGSYNNRQEKDVIEALSTMFNNNSGRNAEIMGFTKIPPMISFNGFNLIDGFVTDHLHCVQLGVMKRLLDIWLGKIKSSKFKPLSAYKTAILNKRLLNMKPISSVTRLPRPVTDRKFWKASQYSDLLLYYLYFAIDGILYFNAVKNFRKLSAGIYILLKKNISQCDLLNARLLLDSFVENFEIIYGQETVTMNVHLIKHLSHVVSVAGPLWAYSTFGFEGNMGRIIRAKFENRLYVV